MATETESGAFGRIKRFSNVQVYVHATAALSIFFLFLTGLPITFSEHLGWLFAIFGYGNVVLLHIIAGVALIMVGVYYVTYLLLGVLAGRAGIPALPTLEDAREAVQYGKYLAGRAEKPEADKYGWLQKAEIGVIVTELTLISVTGLLLWYRGLFVSPEFRSLLGGHEPLADFLLLIARDVHLIFALTFLMGIAFHLYIVNVKEKYPFNETMFSGDVSVERAAHHWPAWARKKLGELPGHVETAAPSKRTLAGITFALLLFFAVVVTATLFAAVFSPLPTRDYLIAVSGDVLAQGMTGIVYFLGLNVAVLMVVGGSAAIIYGISKRLRGEYDV